MARIPSDEIERLKSEISVERLIASAGIALNKVGRDRVGKCPFHADDTASLVVTPPKNLWHCFGCQLGGGPIDWVMRNNAVSFRHAVEILRDGGVGGGGVESGDAIGEGLAAASIAAPDGKPSAGSVQRTSVRTLAAPVSRDADCDALMGQVISYYHDTLKQSPDALAYLQARGLNHPELIDTFKLGFANRTLGLRLPAKNRVTGAELRTRLQAIGIYRQSGHEHFNGSLIVPVMDETGRVVEVYGRKLLDNLRAGTPKHLYLPEGCRGGDGHGGNGAADGAGRGVWNIQALQASTEIIVCEALIDAMTFWCAGYRNVTAAYGIEGFTDTHLAAFERYGVKRVLIAYDRDVPGERAAQKLADKLMACGMECWRIQFPKGMDANEYALKVTPAAKSLGVAIRKAVWIGNGNGNGKSTEQAPARPPENCASQQEQNNPTSTPSAVATSPQNALKTPVNRPSSAIVNASIAVLPIAAVAAAPSSLAAALPAATMSAPAPVLPASPMPPAPTPAPADTAATVTDNEVVMTFGDGQQGQHTRRYRVRGLAKNTSYALMKVNVMVSLGASGERFHVDTLDCYSAKARASYVTQAAIELQVKEEILKADLGRVLLKLEALQDAQIQQALTPKPPAAVAISEADTRAAIALLTSPDLLARIVADFDACGIVGEASNKLTGYLAAVSRKLDRPLAIVIQSSSAAGKSSLMDAVLAFMPEEERIKYSAMTGQSLFYMGETNLKNKILAIVEEEGASRASYALKLLQSEGELTIASTGKDPVTGNLITQQYRVEGPVMIFLTTTAIEIDEELMNRCLVLSVDEGRAQTQAIHQLQRTKRTLQGLMAKQDKQHILELHRNAQRLIKPLHVVNPYADQLTFTSDKTRTRRDHEKYLTLIDTIALLHQHQRVIRTIGTIGTTGTTSTAHHHHGQHQEQTQPVQYIEVTLDDIARANALAHEVLGRSLDELPPQTRRLLGEIVGLVRVPRNSGAGGVGNVGDINFTRKDVREATGWSDTQLRVHLDRLVEMEYLATHREGAGGKFVYALMYDGACDAKPHLSGLLDVAAMVAAAKTSKAATTTTVKSRGIESEVAVQDSELAARLRDDNGAITGRLQAHNSAVNALFTGRSAHMPLAEAQTHVFTNNGNSHDKSPPLPAPVHAGARGHAANAHAHDVHSVHSN